MNKKLFVKAQKGVIDEKNRIIAGVVGSTGIIDRQGESINPTGWDLTNFSTNPVVLYAHDYSSLPVGKAEKVWIEDGKLMFNIRFADTDFANDVWTLFKQGMLSAFSVGFMPLELDSTGKFTYDKQELLELSVVPVPANPQALADLKGAAPILYKMLSESKTDDEDTEDSEEEDSEEEKVADETINKLEEVPHADDPAEEIEGNPAFDADAEEDQELDGGLKLSEITVDDFRDLLLHTLTGLRNNDGTLMGGEKSIAEKTGRTLSQKHEQLLRHASDDINQILSSVGQEQDDKTPQSGVDTIPDADAGKSIENKPLSPGARKLLKQMSEEMKKSDKHLGLGLQTMKKLQHALKGGE